MASKTAIEVSPSDERDVEAVVTQGLRALDELEATIEAFDEISEKIPGLGWMGLTDHYGYLDSCKRVLQTAGISRGRLGFALWYWYRVLVSSPISDILDDLSKSQHGPFLSAERAIKALAPELLVALDRGAAYPSLGDEEFAGRAGMERAQVEDRARAAITQIIESERQQ